MYDKKKKMKEMSKDDMEDADMGKMHPMMKQAKMGVLKHLSDMASEAMSGKLHDGLKKVSVASDTEEGLKKGIDKAKEIVESGHIPGSSAEVDDAEEADKSKEGDEAEEAEESPEMESAEEEMSAEDLEKKIAELKAKLEAKKA